MGVSLSFQATRPAPTSGLVIAMLSALMTSSLSMERQTFPGRAVQLTRMQALAIMAPAAQRWIFGRAIHSQLPSHHTFALSMAKPAVKARIVVMATTVTSVCATRAAVIGTHTVWATRLSSVLEPTTLSIAASQLQLSLSLSLLMELTPAIWCQL